MNILQAHKYYWPRDGASRYMVEIGAALSKRGHTVVPFAMQHTEALRSPYERFFVSERDIHDPHKLTLWQKITHAQNIVYSFEARKKLQALLAETHIDVAHIHNIYHHISPSILGVLKKNKIPIVMTLHDYKLLSPNYALFHHGQIHEEDANGWYLTCIKNSCTKDSRAASAFATFEMILHHKIFRFYEKYVDRFIAPSQFMIDLCVKHGWPREKFIYLPNPVTLPPGSAAAEGTNVTYVGRVSEEKGLKVLLEAAQKTPGIPYRIVGDGPQKKELENFVRAHNVQNVSFAGFLSGKKLEAEFESARFFVLPAVWYENNPLSVLEAKARGKLTIASALGGLSEMLPQELLVPPGDSVHLAESLQKWYSASLSERRALGEKLRQEVKEKNDVEAHLDQLEKIYNTLRST